MLHKPISLSPIRSLFYKRCNIDSINHQLNQKLSSSSALFPTFSLPYRRPGCIEAPVSSRWRTYHVRRVKIIINSVFFLQKASESNDFHSGYCLIYCRSCEKAISMNAFQLCMRKLMSMSKIVEANVNNNEQPGLIKNIKLGSSTNLRFTGFYLPLHNSQLIFILIFPELLI